MNDFFLGVRSVEVVAANYKEALICWKFPCDQDFDAFFIRIRRFRPPLPGVAPPLPTEEMASFQLRLEDDDFWKNTTNIVTDQLV